MVSCSYDDNDENDDAQDDNGDHGVSLIIIQFYTLNRKGKSIKNENNNKVYDRYF